MDVLYTKSLSKVSTFHRLRVDPAVQVGIIQGLFDGLVAADGDERLGGSHEKSHDRAVDFAQIDQGFVNTSRWIVFRHKWNVTDER